MRQSNSYIVIYAAVLTIVCGVLLAVAAEGLRPRQQENIALEQKANILSTAMTLDPKADIADVYAKRVKAYVVNSEGKVLDGVKAEDVVLADEYKKPVDQRRLPVYEILNESDPNKTENYVLPLYGYGLWNNIWGFVSLKADANTIAGVNFDHAGETAGLGARIATPEIQQRYQGKKVFEGDEIVAVRMMKGEGGDYSDNPHQVDGMSGATITAKGVNEMMSTYLSAYEKFLESKKSDVKLTQASRF